MTFVLQTHCKQGHPLIEGNIAYITRNNGRIDRMCRTCARARTKKWNRNKYRLRHGIRTGKKRKDGTLFAGVSGQRARWRRRHPEKAAAHLAVYKAVKSGVLQREPCNVCGDLNVHGHHHLGYGKPLEVEWLCPKHHRKVHSLTHIFPPGKTIKELT